MKLRSLFILAALALLVAACAHAPYTGRNQLILISPRQEFRMGAQAANEVMATEKISRDPRYVKPVEQIGRRIAAVSGYPSQRWQFTVIDDPETANAFALPGGKVFVYTGLFRYARNDAELAAVMAHEIGHVIARHGAERMSSGLLAEVGREIAAQSLGIDSPQAVDAFNAAFGLTTNLALILPHSRTQEYEADKIGILLMAKAGYDPRAAVSFWENMSRSSGPGTPEFLSTHPTNQHRVQELKGMLPEAMSYYRRTGS